MKRLVATLPLFIVACFYLFNTPSVSKVFMNREEALKTAFPRADKIEKTELFLNDEQVKEIESLSKSKLDSELYIVNEGKKGDEILGYSIIDTHSLRLGKDIPLITGATITSNFLAQAVRRVLAVFRVGVLNAETDKGVQE